MNTRVVELKEGDFISETQYYKVKNVQKGSFLQDGFVDLTNERNQPLRIAENILEEATYTASQFSETVKLTATELAQIFSTVGSDVFEVSFNKLPQAKDINEAISGLNKGSFPTDKQIKETVVTAYKGQERILRGYLHSIEPLMGRAKVVDLEVKLAENSKDPGYRLVDFRTLNYLIHRGVKYVLK